MTFKGIFAAIPLPGKQMLLSIVAMESRIKAIIGKDDKRRPASFEVTQGPSQVYMPHEILNTLLLSSISIHNPHFTTHLIQHIHQSISKS